MRVYLDAQALQSQTSANRGIARYVRESVRALLRRHPEVVGAIALNPGLDPARDVTPDPETALPVEWNTARHFRRTRARTIDETGRDLAYHVLSPFEEIHPVESMLPRHALASGVPLAATVYDFIPLELPDTFLPTPASRRRYRRRLELLRHADLLIAISHYTRRRTIEVLGVDPARVHVSGCGVSEFFCPAPESPADATSPRPLVPGLHKPFVLTVTGEDPRKNATGLIAAWAALPPATRRSFQLVIVGRARSSVREAWIDQARGLGIGEDEIVLAGYVDDTGLRALYRSCALFVFASLAEGYGLPAAEAARCGAVVLTSNTTSLPEVLDVPEATFPPEEPEAIAALVDRALADEPLRDRLRSAATVAAHRTDWASVADRIRAAYDEVLHRSPGAHLDHRPRVALLAATDGCPGDGTDHLDRLADELAPHADVDCVVTRGRRPRSATTDTRRTFPAHALGRSLNPGAYDAVVEIGSRAAQPEHARWVTLRLPSMRDPRAAAQVVLAHLGHDRPPTAAAVG